MGNKMLKDSLGWLKKLFVRDWSLKILAVLLGTLSFYTIRGAISFEVPYHIPVEIKVGPGVAILDQSVKSVDATFRGAQEDLRLLNQREIKAVVQPVAVAASGSETLAIRPEDVQGAGRVRVVSLRPNEITLTFDHEAQKEVSVLKPKLIGRPLVGQAKVEYDPRTVILRGPKRRLDTISSVSAEPLDVDGRVESFTKALRVLPPGDVWISQIEPAEITATVNIAAETTSRQFTNLAVMAMIKAGISRDIVIEPAAVTVTLHGRPEALDNVAPAALRVFVTCAGLSAGVNYELPVEVHMATDLETGVTIEPKSVRVMVRGNDTYGH
jgi:YbbR domain-containing protein